MARAHFSVGDVEALIPALERIFTDVLQLRAALRGIEEKLERAGVKMSREELLESDDGPTDVRRAKALFRGFYEALSDEIEQVRALGGEVKDIEQGLVDFPARRRGEEILLCWRLGEKTIGFWHGLESGFRRPPPDRRRRRARAATAGLRERGRCRASRHCEPAHRGAAEGVGPGSGARIRTSARRPRASRGCGESEFLAGYAMDPAKILGDPVEGEADPDVVVVGGLRFHAMCPHHLLPYRGVAHVAYLPAGKLVGFGRLAELVDCFTKRLTLQERATHQIADALCRHLGARGAGCVIEAEQLCLALPGEKHDQSGVVTSAFVGEMRERPDLKARLLEAAKLGGRSRVSARRARPRSSPGASRGIGRAIAAALAGAGAAVAGCARNPDAGSDLFRCDVGRADDVARFADDVLRPARPARRAGQQRRASSRARRLDEMPVEAWDAVVDSNLKGTFLVTRAFLPAMRARRRRADHQRRLDLRPPGDGAADRLLRRQARRRRPDPRAGRGAARRRHRRERRLPRLGRHRDAARRACPARSRTCRPRTSRAWCFIWPPRRRPR